ncbi:16S rRNA (uracil(1498)-N(3))-methyltransferase [Neomoorella thermoacetica]|uniref:Ribosomal RNA small subunit methyltransferase E n=1 Tax=Neomoorella thermoacetica TaxID=1525 RepID=A0A1J5JND1_NEOTH|nr:16S rRNA (uracil(1498)-N(3))-methyltransferase [Moorella thermoacetica]APC07707.1 ribosomal RNA small subunit methyltransferase E [Moorella thermoacetica]OIQ08227.1 ribosomal RNA small subunit methyltransferase E [Moorella thermoacetica]OIQ53588.1 ribosomal RNA small subunit methyltransferase E [Moorella thermoacetica]
MAHHFFLPIVVAPGETVLLEGENAHHAIRVLRLRQGESITLADSNGQGYRAEIVAITEGRVAAAIKDPLASPEPRVRVTLYQGWPKGDKMDLIIEKCTELGVDRIVVLATERSIPRPDQQTCARRRERWQQKAHAAARQSRRHRIPAVDGPLGLAEALVKLRPDTLLLVPWEEERTRDLKSILATVPADRELALLIGPEGGLSRAEVDLACRFGGLPLTLGPRILRTETAGLACLAAIMYAMGELG